MTMTRVRGAIRPIIVASFAAAPCLSMSSTLQAQEAGSEREAALEEVIVTARRREESLQDTPIAVTALDEFELREAAVYNLYDLNLVVPNIDVHPANGNTQLANIFIRGIGQRNQGPQIDSGVGIYLDEVYLGRPDGALLDLLDIESIQVLRGPQGTLFGKNTTGGAILYSTRRPTEEFEGWGEVRVGNFNRLDAQAVLNVPFSERWLGRLAVSRISRDGYLENHFDGQSYADEDRWNAMGKLRWLALDNLVFDLQYTYSSTDQLTRLQKCLPLPGVIGWQAVLLDATHVLPNTGRSYDDFCQDAADLGDEYDVLSDLGGRYQADNEGLSLEANWDIHDHLSFKSITAWRNTLAGQDDELDYTVLPLLAETQLQHPDATKQDTDQFSQEFHLTGDSADGRLSYVAGLLYWSEQTDADRTVIIIGPFDPGINGLFMHTASSTLLETDNDSWAVFGQVDWAINDHWTLTAGYRYTDEKRRLTRELFFVDAPTLDASGSFVLPAFPGAWVVDRRSFRYNPNFGFLSAGAASASTSNSDGSGMASIQYRLGESGAVDGGGIYLTYAEGFLSGGISEAPGGMLDTFEPEEVENLELGIKLDLLDRRLRINAALFHSDYTNRQLTTIVFDPLINAPAPATINAASSTISGLELESTWLATDRLQLTFNATFNDGDIDEFEDVQLRLADPSLPVAPNCSRSDLTLIFIDSCLIDRSSENLPRLPKRSYFAALQYDFTTSVGTLLPRIQFALKEDIEYCFDASSCASGRWFEDRQFDLSARITWISRNGTWRGSLYGTNLTEETYVVGGFALADSSGVGGIAYNLPRMYGAELRYSF